MRIESVYASKIYRVSKNKESIKSAFENPINSQLVQQLFNQVDDKYKKLDEMNNADAQSTEPKSDNPQVDKSTTQSGESKSNSAPKLNRHFSAPLNFENKSDLDNDTSDKDADSDETVVDDASETDNSIDNSVDSEDVEESAKISENKVEAAKALYTNAEKTHDFKSDCEVIKGTLNSRQDTYGVIRTTVKDNEMWLYYNDSINLNNVMAQVIDVVSNAGYNYLEFNRLARSDNAIVFEINNDVAQEVIKDDDEE